MNRVNLKKLAMLTVSDKETGEKVEQYVLKKLTRPELRTYLFYLRQEIANRKVYIRTASAPDNDVKQSLKNLFAGKDVDINFETVESLGAGLQIEYKDSLLELSLRKLINQSYSQIKESL